jgi:hypothetical protein
MADHPRDAGSEGGSEGGGTVGDVAELYLGNILYAIELAALSLDEQGKRADAAFYRGIGRKLAEARGRAKEREAD